MFNNKDNRISLGNLGEDLVVKYLISKNYKIIARNYRFGHLEIDIITSLGKEFVFFEVKTINSVELNDIPTNSELMPIQIIECNCDILSQQKIKLTFNILLHEHVYILPLVEKMTITILYKIFNRVKQFIENFTI